mmetsp:Transcript_46615/g.109654  ORF Transcript_46615/g.109654 Transcript_46615/m.109654 type:complete len:214 (-) Transcript_46615:6657-7298(-)
MSTEAAQSSCKSPPVTSVPRNLCVSLVHILANREGERRYDSVQTTRRRVEPRTMKCVQSHIYSRAAKPAYSSKCVAMGRLQGNSISAPAPKSPLPTPKASPLSMTHWSPIGRCFKSSITTGLRWATSSLLLLRMYITTPAAMTNRPPTPPQIPAMSPTLDDDDESSSSSAASSGISVLATASDTSTASNLRPLEASAARSMAALLLEKAINVS